MKSSFSYLECEGSNIANIGAIFRGKSAMESTVCVHCRTGVAEEMPLWAVQPAEADGTLNRTMCNFVPVFEKTSFQLPV